MKPKHFILVTLNSEQSHLSERMRPTLDKAIDWVEVAPNAWLLWTSSSSKRWLDRIQTTDLGKAQVFIAEINPSDRAGVMPDDIWTFMKRREAAIEGAGSRRIADR